MRTAPCVELSLRTAYGLHLESAVMNTRTQGGPVLRALAALILMNALALSASGCASSKHNSGFSSQSTRLLGAQRSNPPAASTASTSKPRDAAAGAAGAASDRTGPAESTATTNYKFDVFAAGGAASTTGTTSRQSPSMTATTTATPTRIAREFERSSRSLWPFLVGVAIAAAAGLIFLFLPALRRAR